MFVEGALPGEVVEVERRRKRRGHDEAVVARVIAPSPHRVEPRCVHFGTCGGCVLQHATPELQREMKQRSLADTLQRVGGVTPERWLPALAGPDWRYRRRARLSCRFVEKKGRLLVGFRERGRSLVADLSRCEILCDPVGDLIGPLATLIGGLRQAKAIAQIEVAVADGATVLVLRNLEPLDEDDRAALRAFGAEHGVEFHLQPGGYETIAPLDPPGSELAYALPAHDVTIAFAPDDFVQVNAEVNRALVDRALELMAPEHDECFMDLFCGLGNFSLPLARRAAAVTGVEGDERLVRGATANATRNGIANARFHAADLTAPADGAAWAEGPYDGVLLDPPRTGAREVLPLVARWAPRRIVYVSCHPGTLARDAGILVSEHGYRLAAAGIADMFPHTAHVESIALFER